MQIKILNDFMEFYARISFLKGINEMKIIISHEINQ